MIGIFSVVFASELLIVGLCMGGYVAILPMFGRLMESSQKQMETQAEASKKAELDALAEKEKAAKTEQQKIDIAVASEGDRVAAEIAVRRDDGREQGDDGRPDLHPLLLGRPAFRDRPERVDAGLGGRPAHWRPWARTLGVWTAALKLVPARCWSTGSSSS